MLNGAATKQMLQNMACWRGMLGRHSKGDLEEHVAGEISDEGLESKGLPQTQSLRIWMPQDLPEPSERAFKKTASTKYENNCPQLLLGSLYSDCSCGELLLNSILNVALKAFQRGSEKAVCTLVNWKLFVTNHPSPSLNIRHQKEVGAKGAEGQTQVRGELLTVPVAPVFLGHPRIIYVPFGPCQGDFRRRKKKDEEAADTSVCHIPASQEL